jgi:hypothetical protein
MAWTCPIPCGGLRKVTLMFEAEREVNDASDRRGPVPPARHRVARIASPYVNGDGLALQQPKIAFISRLAWTARRKYGRRWHISLSHSQGSLTLHHSHYLYLRSHSVMISYGVTRTPTKYLRIGLHRRPRLRPPSDTESKSTAAVFAVGIHRRPRICVTSS